MTEIDGTLHSPGRIGMVGIGAFGRFCIDAYQRSGSLQVVAVADPSPSARERLEGSSIPCSAHWRDVVSNDEVEVIHVATPPYLRLDIVLASLGAGKSVFIEKPLALTLEDADAMLLAEAQSTASLGIDYVMRHLPAYQLLERISSSGIAGSPRSFSFRNYAQSVPKDHWFWRKTQSGGILVEHGVHFFDVYGRIAGAPVELWGSAPRAEVVDVCVRYESGVLGHFYHEFAFPQAVELATGAIMFERGHVLIEGWIPTQMRVAILGERDALQRILGSDVLLVEEGDGSLKTVLSFGDRIVAYSTSIVAGISDLILRHRDPSHQMKVSVADARWSLELALAAQCASERHSTHRFAFGARQQQ